MTTRTARKGAIGEAIIKSILESKGLIIYECRQDKPHVVDFYVQHKGGKLLAVEVKTYPRRYNSETTGVDLPDFHTYVGLLAQGVDVLLFFVDEFEGLIYMSWISDLQRQAKSYRGKVYFPLQAMQFLQHKKLVDIHHLCCCFDDLLK